MAMDHIAVRNRAATTVTQTTEMDAVPSVWWSSNIGRVFPLRAIFLRAF